MSKAKCLIIGSGNIGSDLMMKISECSDILEVGAVVGVDPQSRGLAMARDAGIETSHEGIEGAMMLPSWKDIEIVFDATSAYAHQAHHDVCIAARKKLVDLTPAAIGPYCVPVVNMDAHIDEPNVNLVTCGGQATIPIVHAVARASSSLPFAEIVASVSSRSAGPGTRANIDEFTQTTKRGLEVVGGAGNGKAIIILNPAEPPLIMRDTVYTFSQGGDEGEIEKSVHDIIAQVQRYVPGYRLKQPVQFERYGANRPLSVPGYGEIEGLKTTVFLEVEGAGHFLPKYAGNLDIMTSAARAVGERMASQSIH